MVDACKAHALSLVVFCAMVALLFSGLHNAQQASQSQALEMVEQSIARAMVTCYAVEGVYPESFAYLQENYGLAVDESKYMVDYQAFASNIMPTVTVLEVAP